MPTTINMTLSTKSIQNAIKQIEDYKKSLKYKCEEVVERLLASGENVALQNISQSPIGVHVSVKSDMSPTQTGTKGLLYMSGGFQETDDGRVFHFSLAIEFGSGIHYNKVPNPNADKFGLGVGTFPGQVHAFEDTWFYWDETVHEWRPTHGVKATMPMYNASVEMRNKVTEIVKSVFKS